MGPRFPAPPVLLTLTETARKSTPSRRPASRASYFSLTAPTASRCSRSNAANYPASDVPGEVAARQQCLPAKPAPFARQRLTADLLTNRTPEAHQWALEKFRTFRSDGQFVPFSVGKDTVIFPGFDGGAEWGGAAADPETGILYVNANDLAWTGALAENTPAENAENSPKALYLSQCAVCHGEKMAGSPPAIPVTDRNRRPHVCVRCRLDDQERQGPHARLLQSHDGDQVYGSAGVRDERRREPGRK